MGLFGFGKKKEENAGGCCCGGACDANSMENAKEAMNSGESIKVLGTGCSKCNELESNVKKALEELGMNTNIEHVTDFIQIAAYGVMSTPALVVDGKVVSYGKVLNKDEALIVLRKARGL